MAIIAVELNELVDQRSHAKHIPLIIKRAAWQPLLMFFDWMVVGEVILPCR